MNNTKDISLGDSQLFELAIGKRITKSELQSLPSGNVQIISARLDIPFGLIQSDRYLQIKENIVLWNIDSSRWATRVLEGNTKFIPTDHCGYIKILHKEIVPEYIAYKLYEQGLDLGFTHEFRASLKNIRNIIIPIPITPKGYFDVKKQQVVSSKYFKNLTVREALASLVNDLSDKRININSSSSTSTITIGTIMDFQKGKSKYSEKYCNDHHGVFPVYSAGTKGCNIIGKIDTNDYNMECLKITTNGFYAGTVEYIPQSKFSLNGDVGILYLRNKDFLKEFDYQYLEYALQKAREQYGFNWNNKPSEEEILAIEIAVPKKGKTWNIEEQKRIAQKYQMYKKYIGDLKLCIDNIKKRFIKVD